MACLWGEEVQKVEELHTEKAKKAGELSPKIIGTTADSSVQRPAQHRTTFFFCALEHARSSYKPAIVVGS